MRTSRQGNLQILRVRRRLLVQDHEVDVELSPLPILVGLKEIAYERQLLLFIHVRENMGRSPDMPCPHNALAGYHRVGWRLTMARSDAIGVQQMARQSLKQIGLLRRDAEVAQLTCACDQASVVARTNALGLACLSTSAMTSSRDRLTSVQNAMRTEPPGRTRTRRRERRSDRARHRRCSTAAADRLRQSEPALQPRPTKRARSVSICKAPRSSPSTTECAAAQTSGSCEERRRRVASSRPLPGYNPFRRTISKTRDAPNRLRRAPAPARRSRSLRFHAPACRGLKGSRAGLRRRSPARRGHQHGRQSPVAPLELGAGIVKSRLLFVRFDAARLISRRPHCAGPHSRK